MTLPSVSDSPPVLYFGYGSNMWLEQMRTRCPESKFVGIASLKDWKWIISSRGYANVIRSPSDLVYGLMFELSESDESSLDHYEGVPVSYIKETIPVEFTSTSGEKKTVEALVYIDEKRIKEGKPWKEYIDRMNNAIADAVKTGVPRDYITKYLRPFIRADNEEELEDE